MEIRDLGGFSTEVEVTWRTLKDYPRDSVGGGKMEGVVEEAHQEPTAW